MTALEYILDGLEAELALERELGVRVIECDRSVLAEPASPRPPSSVVRPSSSVVRPSSFVDGQRTKDGGQRNADEGRRTKDERPRTMPDEGQTTAARPDFVFLHDRPLSPKGVEMMAKIVTAMGKTADTAPVVIVPPVPKAKAYVVLGGLALRKFFPGGKAEPGQWIKGPKGEDVLVTYSPEYILRFGTVTPAVKKMKQDMWTSLKGVLQRTR